MPGYAYICPICGTDIRTHRHAVECPLGQFDYGRKVTNQVSDNEMKDYGEK